MNQNYAVLGLGKFGFNVAKGLAQQGLSVIAIDQDEDQVREINEFVQDAIILDHDDNTHRLRDGLTPLFGME